MALDPGIAAIEGRREGAVGTDEARWERGLSGTGVVLDVKMAGPGHCHEPDHGGGQPGSDQVQRQGPEPEPPDRCSYTRPVLIQQTSNNSAGWKDCPKLTNR